MTFSVRIKRSAAKELAGIARPARDRLVEAIDALADNPGRGSVLKGELRGLRRLRVGEYRVVYEVMDDVLVVLVIRVRRRREAYGRR